MKYLTDRKEIAQAMNFGKYPVLTINMETPKAGWEDVFAGCTVRIDTGKSYCDEAHLRYYGDEKHFVLAMHGACLSSSFGYSDVMEMRERAMAPKVKAGDTVVVIEDFPNKSQCKVHMMKVPEKINTMSTGVSLMELD